MDPQQELFSELLVKIKELGYDVYDGFLPPEGTPYPFIYLADNRAGRQRDEDRINRESVPNDSFLEQ